jgi:hypothetical protein
MNWNTLRQSRPHVILDSTSIDVSLWLEPIVLEVIFLSVRLNLISRSNTAPERRKNMWTDALSRHNAVLNTDPLSRKILRICCKRLRPNCWQRIVMP